MANVSFKKGLVAALPTTYSEGTFYVTTDERAIYLDVSDSARIRLGDFQEFATVAALDANTNPSTSALYYVTDINCLAKWDGTKYVQINRDTGMTSVEVTGSGNAVTAAVYSAEGRKLTLTKGATFMTASDVDSKISAKVGEIGDQTVKAYVDAKTEGIATDAALAELQGKVTTAEGEIDALQADSHTHANKTELDKIASGDKAKWDEAASAVTAIKDGESIDSFADVETALAGKQAVGDYATKAQAQGYADAKDTAIAAAKKAGDDAQADVDALEAKVGTVTDGKTVVEMISAAQAAATYDDTALAGRVTAVEGKVSTLVGDDANKSARTIASEEVAKIVAGADESYDTLKEISDWISSHSSDAASMNSAIVALQAIVDGIGDTANGEKATVVAYVDDAIAALKIGDYAKAADLTALAARVSTLEGKAHEHSNKAILDGITAAKVSAWDAAEQNAKDYADGLAGNYDASGAAAQALADAKTYANGLASNYDAAGSADTALASAKSYADGLAGNYDAAGSATTALNSAKSYADGLAGNYDASGSADDALASAKSYTDGKLAWGEF